jgi:sensor histidine kinase YesM
MTNDGYSDGVLQRRRGRLLFTGGIILGVWVAAAALSATFEYVSLQQLEIEESWASIFFEQLPVWLLWALWTPVILALARYAPIQRGAWKWPLFLHLATSIVWMAVYAVFSILYLILLDVPSDMLRESVMKLLSWRFYIDYFIFWAVVAFAHALEYYRRYMAQQQTAERLRGQEEALQRRLAESRLRYLRAQIQPHFLFNALNAAVAQIRKREHDPAIGLLTGLSDLLRRALSSDARTTVPLREELAFAEEYLRIQSLRFPDRLSYRIEAGPDAEDVPVPDLILQPLVENALMHGASGSGGEDEVTIVARLDGRHLVVEMTNRMPEGDGPQDAESEEGSGIGLTNTRERLELLYGGEFGLLLEPTSGDRVKLVMRVPRQLRDTAEDD